MDELENRLAQLKQKSELAAAERTRAFAKRELGKEKVSEAVRQLKNTFGVSSIAEAEALHESLTLEARASLDRANELLSVVENA